MRPAGRVGRDDIDVTAQDEGAPRAMSGIGGEFSDEIGPLFIGTNNFGLEAEGAAVFGEMGDRTGLVTGRIARVKADELLQKR